MLAPGDGGLGASIGVAIAASRSSPACWSASFNGMVVAVARVQPIVATLGMLVAGRGIALVITGGALVELFVPFFKTVRLGKFLGVPYVMWVAALLAVARRRSWSGAPRSATGCSPSAATAGPACWPACRCSAR